MSNPFVTADMLQDSLEGAIARLHSDPSISETTREFTFDDQGNYVFCDHLYPNWFMVGRAVIIAAGELANGAP